MDVAAMYFYQELGPFIQESERQQWLARQSSQRLPSKSVHKQDSCKFSLPARPRANDVQTLSVQSMCSVNFVRSASSQSFRHEHKEKPNVISSSYSHSPKQMDKSQNLWLLFTDAAHLVEHDQTDISGSFTFHFNTN